MIEPFLVTGANGYLGGQVRRIGLANGLNMIASSRQGGGEDIFIDLLDKESVKSAIAQVGPCTVIHSAANVPTSMAAYNDPALGDDNHRMVENIIDAGVNRLVFVSSMTVYSTKSERTKYVEADADGGESLYAKSKFASEQYLNAVGDIDGAIIRIPGLFGGTRAQGLIYNAAQSLMDDKLPTINGTPTMWASMHVEDAANSIVVAAMKHLSGLRTVNVGYENEFSVDGMVNMIAAHMGRPHRIDDRGPWFTMDLSKACALGILPAAGLKDRLDEVIQSIDV